jgi:hypothetical protein
MTTIVDFKILTAGLYGVNYKEAIQKFNNEVNTYLQKGYTLHGTTLNTGINWVNHKFIQAVVKYSGISPGPIIKNYNLMYVTYPYNTDNMELRLFEKNICDEIRNGYILHGDIQYLETDKCGSENNYSQALIKISTPKVTLTEDLEGMRLTIAKQADSLADFQEEVGNHNRAIAEVRLDIESQGKIIRRQKRLIDELTVALDNLKDTNTTATNPTEVNLTNTIKPVVPQLDFLDI